MIKILKIIQQYFNRYISSSELLEALEHIDAANVKNKEPDYTKMISGIKNAIKTTDNEKDSLVNEEITKLEATIEEMEEIKQKSTDLPKEIENYISQLYNKRGMDRDNRKRWIKVSDTIRKSDYYQNTLNSLSDLELLELISDDIRAPYPMEISEGKYNDLVKTGIENDKREWLWRLAFNYSDEPYDITPIAQYFLDKNDCYYLTELISVVGDKLNIKDIIVAVSKKPQEFKDDFIQAEPIMNRYITKDQFESLKS